LVVDEFPLYRAAFSGLLAMLTGIGIARFGYAPLVPALVAAHWFSASAAFWLGASNLLGYLIGAGAMRSWRGAVNARRLIIILMALTTFSVLASAWNAGVIYAGIWRLLTGMTGGALMVLMGAAVVGRAPAAARGKVGGITFAGMGAGIMISGLVIPRILPFGLPITWAALGIACLTATLIVASIMPRAAIPAAKKTSGAAMNLPVLLIIIAYGLVAIGFVPHILFWASFIALGLHRGITAGAAYSTLLGVSAMLGPPVLGRIADRFGFQTTLSLSYFAMSICLLCPLLFAANAVTLAVSSIGVGVVALGVVVLTSGALAGLLPVERLSSTWGLATLSFSALQAASAAGFSTLFHATGNYQLLYAIAAVATFAAGAFVAGAVFFSQRTKNLLQAP
jgi:predicted MFS family arabinose efflux permease